MDLVGPTIAIVKCVGGPIVRYLKHQIKFKDNLEKFKGSKEDLYGRKCDIESRLNTDLRYGKVAKPEVQRWLKDVEDFIARKDVADEVKGWGCLSCCCRVKILEERAQELKEIYSRGNNYTNECLVIDDPSALAVELPTTVLQGNEAVKASILACLKGKEVTKLGVWGMGGVGKTTIMKHVHNELLKEGKFKKIIWVSVSQNFDINKLQEQIACSLKEKLEELQNATNRAAVLSKMLEKKKPYLLILDDVWNSFILEDVGIPEPYVADSCKLVLTTRSQEIARSMGCKRIKVETLSQEEALKLFLNKVGDTVLSDHGGGIKNDLESTLKKIVDECDGLPLAIVTVASSLKEISEPSSWRVALNDLRDCKRNVAGTEDDDDAFKILKFSYDRLKNPKIQYCFLYCALYPEDYNIPKEEIIEYWIDEGFIDEMETRHAMKDKGRDILRKLEENSLLEFEDEEDCVRMHDLIRDMALDITRSHPRFLVEAGKALRELPEKVKCTEDVKKVSLMYNYIEEIPSSMASSTCTRLATLLLAGNKLSTIPESVFEHMPELKILDLSFNEELRSLPNSASKLVHLTALLLEWTSIEKIPSLSGLGSLKRLNLRGTAIKEVPEGLGMLTNLKCLALCGSYPPYKFSILQINEIADGVLSNLSKLEELFIDWSRIELKGEVVGRLMKLEVFHGLFPTVNEIRIFLKYQPNRRLSSYFITVGSKAESVIVIMMKGSVNHRIIANAIRRPPRYKKIMVFNETSGIVGENVLFPSVQILCIKSCQDVRSLNDFSAIKDETVTDLRGCWILNCDGMEWVLSSWINNPIVQTLEYLVLGDLPKLDGLFEAKVNAQSTRPRGIFSSLKTIDISRCRKIKKLFPSWKLAEYLQSLEKIDIEWCEEMEEIIASDPEEGGDIIKKLILPKLKELTLSYLPALKSICSGKRAVMVCDSLEVVHIRYCKGLRGIFVYLPSSPYLFVSDLDKLDGLFEAQVIAPNSPPPPTAFSSLKTIEIVRCDKIKKLFPSWKLVEYLQSLEKIEVEDCEEMEEIIASDPEEEEGEGGGDIIKKLILPKLKQLTLSSLPALKSICSAKRAVMACDSLEWIDISNCKGLRGIFVYLPSPPYLFVSDLDKLDGLFEAQVIAKLPPPSTTFSSLKTIKIRSCNKIKRLFPSWKLVEYLQSLEKINVCDCEEMEEIIASDPEEGGDIIKKLILPKLKELTLSYLPALKSICSGKRAIMVYDSLEVVDIRYCKGLRRIFVYLPSGPYLFVSDLDKLDGLFEAQVIAPNSPPPPTAFSSLKTVRIYGCHKIKKLFPSWKLVEYLQSLENIEVRGCEEMEEIIASDPEEEEGEGGGDIIKKLILPKLKVLALWDLPALKSICCGKRAIMACDSLEVIFIWNCKGLRRIFVYLPSGPYLFVSDLDKLDGLFEAQVIAPNSPPPPTAFSSLKTVRIYGCHKIKKLFPSWKLVEYLQSLEKIDVEYCEEMEEIIASDPEEEGEEGEERGDIIKTLILPKLNKLTLGSLPALKSLCGERRTVMACDSLEWVDISNCKGLRGIFVYLPSPPYLFVSDLNKLDGLFEAQVIAPNSPPPPTPFLSLKGVRIQGCHKIKKLFPSWKLVEYLQSLEKIEVEDCEEMEEIIASDPEEEGEEGGDIIKTLILPKLNELTLGSLPALKSLCSWKRAVMACDSLERIEIRDCKGLRRIFVYLPSGAYLFVSDLDKLDGQVETQVIAPKSAPPLAAFSSLKTIQIKSCHKIKKLFPSWKLVEYLQSLEKIGVRDCEEMEEIIASDPEEEGEEGGDIIKKFILPKLKELTLQNLPALKSICSRRAVMACDSLEEIGIGNCKSLRRIPIYLPLPDNAQPSPPHFLQRIVIYPEEQEWWESLEWDHPNAKDFLRPLLHCYEPEEDSHLSSPA